VTLRMSPLELERLKAKQADRMKDLRARLRKIDRLQPAKGRTVVYGPNRKAVSIAFVPKINPADGARHSVKVDPNRVMAVDLSTAKSGLAWGKPGHKPEGTLCFMEPGTRDEQTEGERLHSMAYTIAREAVAKGCGLIIFGEFYAARMMLAFRANSALRGALMAEAARWGLEARPIAEITARKAAGVDISRPKDDEGKGYMKARARKRLEELDLGYLQEDEGDAALLLFGSCGQLGIAPPETKEESHAA